VMYTETTAINCIGATWIFTVSRYPVNCRICHSAPTTELGRCRSRPALPRISLRLEGG
jgi:hypothetical protein